MTDDNILTLAVAIGRVETHSANMVKLFDEMRTQFSGLELRLRRVEDSCLTFKGGLFLISSYTVGVISILKVLGATIVFGG